MPHKIDIIGIDSVTGKLILSDRGKTEVNSQGDFRQIKWKTEFEVVKSFIIVGKTSYNPFEEPIPLDYDDKVKLKVRKREPDLDWEYSIHWKNKDGKVTVSDPLIAIRSSRKDKKDHSLIVWLLVSLGLLGASVLYWRQKKKVK